MKTNEQAKREAIKKIVSDYYDKYPEVKPFVQSNGFFPITNGYVSNLHEDVRDFYHFKEKVFMSAEDHEDYYSHFIPKELNDLIEEVDNNNGWIRIEPDRSNLPEPGEYRWLFESGSMSNFYYEPGDIMSTKLTHYKQITPELKPIY